MAPPNATGSSHGLVLVLGAGGARGVAHAAVLRGLRTAGIPIDTIVGCSVGAIVAAMHAAAGMEPDEMLRASRSLNASALFSFALSRWRIPFVSRAAGRRAGSIPGFLARLEGASFERLYFGVRSLGVLTFDLMAREDRFVVGGPGLPAELSILDAVKASAAIPFVFPPLKTRIGGRTRYLADAGWFTAVPIERAFAPPLLARRVIAVDLSIKVCLRQARRSYWRAMEEACGDRLVVLRPDVRGCGTMISWPDDPARLIEAGEASVDRALGTIRSWLRADAAQTPAVLDSP